MSGTLAERLRRRIAMEGPLSLADWMQEALGDPDAGYYMTRDPLGAAGDFTTAPEISQLFGEMIGAWLLDRWEAMGAPATMGLVELGPGRGTLMADILRVARLRPAFRPAVHLVETSPVLRARQREALSGHDVTWSARLEDVPEAGPLLLIANEFFDALPIRQAVRTPQGWRERGVGLDPAGAFLATLLPRADCAVPEPLAHLPEGSVIEWCPAAETLARQIARRILRSRGAALIIDYGHTGPAAGDTLQAVRGHRPADPFDSPGEVDLTAHVDFGALLRAMRGTGVQVQGPTPLGPFLETLGIGLRADALARRNPAAAPVLATARHRLTAPEAMGSLFKVMGLAPPGSPPAPGFPC